MDVARFQVAVQNQSYGSRVKGQYTHPSMSVTEISGETVLGTI